MAGNERWRKRSGLDNWQPPVRWSWLFVVFCLALRWFPLNTNAVDGSLADLGTRYPTGQAAWRSGDPRLSSIQTACREVAATITF